MSVSVGVPWHLCGWHPDLSRWSGLSPFRMTSFVYKTSLILCLPGKGSCLFSQPLRPSPIWATDVRTGLLASKWRERLLKLTQGETMHCPGNTDPATSPQHSRAAATATGLPGKCKCREKRTGLWQASYQYTPNPAGSQAPSTMLNCWLEKILSLTAIFLILRWKLSGDRRKTKW